MKIVLFYALAIIPGLLLIILTDIKWFLFYLLICLLVIGIELHSRIDYNRKMLRLTLISSDVKLLSLAKKLNVGKKDMKKILKEMKTMSSEKDWKKFKKDIADITQSGVMDDLN